MRPNAGCTNRPTANHAARCSGASGHVVHLRCHEDGVHSGGSGDVSQVHHFLPSSVEAREMGPEPLDHGPPFGCGGPADGVMVVEKANSFKVFSRGTGDLRAGNCRYHPYLILASPAIIPPYRV